MNKTINLDGYILEYNLEYKRVKNINLRIKSDASFHVSANRRVSVREIEAFMKSKSDFILKAIHKFESAYASPTVRHYGEEELKSLIIGICQKNHPYFESKGIGFPVIKFRKMVSRWGTCNYVKGIITFNTALMYAPYECIEYVVLHEFCHFLRADHSALFYKELEKVCPEYKKNQKLLKSISIRQIFS